MGSVRRGSPACSLAVLVVTLFLVAELLVPAALPQDSVKPIIVVYTADLSNFRDAIVEELSKDPRISWDLVAVESADLLRTALRLPNVKAVVLAGTDYIAFEAMENSVVEFFNEGGGLVAFHDYGNPQVAGDMATRVFPLAANLSRLGQFKEGRMQHELVKQDVMEIDRDSPANFSLFDSEINLAWNSVTKKCAYLPPSEGEAWVLYRDAQYGAPIVLAYRSAGLSVIFANGDVSDLPEDKFTYFGNFFYDEDFLALFRNSVAWVAEGETRTAGLGGKIAALEDQEEELDEQILQADREERSRDLRAQVLRTILALGCLAGIVLAYVFLVRQQKTAGLTEDRSR